MISISNIQSIQNNCCENAKDICDPNTNMAQIKNLDEEIKRLYVDEKFTLRKVGRIIGKDHHYIKRRLVTMGVEITRKDRKHEPISEETRRKISKSAKGRVPPWTGKKMPKSAIYKNMLTHIRWDISLDFLTQFDNIEKLKCLNKMLFKRTPENFSIENYKLFITKFYYDEKFNKQFNYFSESKNKWDMPSLDHIIPLSKGGTWDLDNLQILSWFENRAKCNMDNQEFDIMINRYFRNRK